MRPAEGWQQRIADEQPDEIEVHFVHGHFVHGDQEWVFEVETDGGRMQISKQLKIRNAPNADFQIESAAGLWFIPTAALCRTPA